MNSSVALLVELNTSFAYLEGRLTGRRRVAVAIGVIVRVVVDGLERRAGETGEHLRLQLGERRSPRRRSERQIRVKA
jgi:hypothetical protein